MKKSSALIYFFLLFIFCVEAHAVSPVYLRQISIKQKPTSIRLKVSRWTHYKSFSLHHPERLVIDLSKTQLKATLPKIKRHPMFRTLRVAKKNNSQLRLVFELKKRQTVKVTQRTIQGSRAAYITLNLSDVKRPKHAKRHNKIAPFKKNKRIKTPPKKIKVTKATVKKSVKKNEEAEKIIQAIAQNVPVHEVIVHSTTPEKLRNVVVMIDPGHGGKDPGAIGAKGTKEKDITLAISIALRNLLNTEPGIVAHLTRKGDYYVRLRDRLSLARRYGADIFISIHADAFKKSNSHGVSVFALSQRGASSEAAHWLAEKENTSELGGVKLNDKSYLLRSVLLDLSQTATISSSLQLGHALLTYFKKFTKLHNTKVEQARFVVLKSPDIPSVLIETGFISNRREEWKLRSPSYRNKIARAIWQGIDDYFWLQAPSGTLVAAERYARSYKVKSGDTLGQIAKNYGVNISAIRQFNKLHSNHINVGQTLHIPESEQVS